MKKERPVVTVFGPNFDTESPRRCGGLDFFGGGEIGDGAADFEYPTVGAGAQAQFVLAPALRISDWVVAAHDRINRATIACLG